MTEPVCVISGVGPGTGSALARRFAHSGYRVAILARNSQRLKQLERDLADSKPTYAMYRMRLRSRRLSTKSNASSEAGCLGAP
jgi:NADP-dependent 3-hydroxy acid dehydrogenase YdfG